MRNAVLFLTFALLPLNVAGQNFSTPSSPRPLPLASPFLPAISIPFGNTKPELSLSGLSQTSQPDNDAIRVSLRLYGGATYLTGGDINEGVRGQNELLTTILNNEFVVDVQGEVEPVHWGVEYGGDVIIHLTPRLGIGVGVSRLEATQTSEIVAPDRRFSFLEFQIPNRVEVRAVPIRLGVFYTLPASRRLNVVLIWWGGVLSHRFLVEFARR